MQDAAAIEGIESRYAALALLMDERMRRQWAAAEARSYGWGGRRAVSQATGMSPNTIAKGLPNWMREALRRMSPLPERLREPGAGRKRVVDVDPELPAALERLVDPETRGDPMSPLRWTCKSTTQLAERVDTARASGQPAHRGAFAESGRVQSAKQSQDEGRARIIPTAMPNSSTSTQASWPSKSGASR